MPGSGSDPRPAALQAMPTAARCRGHGRGPRPGSLGRRLSHRGRNLNVSFRNMLPLEKVVTLESRVVSAEGARSCAWQALLRRHGLCEGECLCITIPGR